MTTLDLVNLKRLVAGDAVATRGVATLEAAGGPDMVFPPTHADEDPNNHRGAKYAFENRRIDGGDVHPEDFDGLTDTVLTQVPALWRGWPRVE